MRRKKKKRHSEEKNLTLPVRVRKHFDAYWQICLALGCRQCVLTDEAAPLESDIDEESEIEAAGD